MTTPSKSELVEAIGAATRSAATELFALRPGDHFYYFSLITTDEGHAPCITAWSREALASAAQGDEEAAFELKWSYADSPFCCFGERHFEPVQRLFEARPRPTFDPHSGWDEERELRFGAMEEAMAKLDSEGIFGEGALRRRIVINVEVMPPTAENVQRALRLNPRDALDEWLSEAAETE